MKKSKKDNINCGGWAFHGNPRSDEEGHDLGQEDESGKLEIHARTWWLYRVCREHAAIPVAVGCN